MMTRRPIHKVKLIHDPGSIAAECSCGWTHKQPREHCRSRINAAILQHFQTVEDATIKPTA